MFAVVTAIISIVGVLLSAIGLYGVVRRLTVDRMKEFGIRVALGATARDLVLLVTEQAMRPVIIGIVIGAAVARAMSVLISPLLFHTTATHAPTYLLVAAVVAGVCASAALMSASGAGRVDPVQQLRHD